MSLQPPTRRPPDLPPPAPDQGEELRLPWDEQAERAVLGAVLLDPAAETRSVLRLHGYGSSCGFPGAADRMLREYERLYGGFTLRQDSWYEREIDGRSAVGFIGDYREAERDIVLYWTYIDSGAYCVEFDFKVPAGRLEDLREELDAIVASYDGPRAPEVPSTASPAVRHNQSLAGFHEVGDQRPVVVFDERSERHR